MQNRPPIRRRPSRTITTLVALLAAGACYLSFRSIYARLPGHPPPIVTHFPDLTPRPPVRFVDRARGAGLDYQWEISGSRPIDILQSIGNGCAFLDYDNDGNLDVLLVGPKLALYKGDGRGHFMDVTRRTDLDKLQGHFLGCAVGDYDNDGYDDVYLSGYRTGLLLHNEHGQGFKDVTEQAGLKTQPWGTTCAFGSFNGSRFLDLFIGNYVDFRPEQFGQQGGPMQYAPFQGVLYHNGGGHFQDVTAAWGVDKTPGRGLGAAWAPLGESGRVGLAVANDMNRDSLLVQAGSGRVRDVAARSGVASVPRGRGFIVPGRMGIDWGDYDNDGRLDLFVTTFQGEPKILLHNVGGDVFQDVGGGLNGPLLSNLAFGAKWLDADNSGRLSLLVSNGHLNDDIQIKDPMSSYRQPTLFLYNQTGRGLADDTKGAGMDTLPLIVGRGLAVGDYDNDGRVDALVVDSEGKPLLLHNETDPAGHWLSLTLVGTRCNRDGYGAMVTVKAGGLTQTRLCHADGSYLSSSDKRVHVGLGAARRAETLSVRWPDGATDTLRGVAADRHLRIVEGTGRAEVLP